MNRRPTFARLVLLGGVLLAVPAATARAESPARPCYRDAEVFPRAPAGIPAGAPALVFVPAAFAMERPISAYEVELRGPDGNVVPHTLTADGPAYLLRPAAALVPGGYEVRYFDLCNFFTPTQKRAVDVRVNEAVALPTTLGAPVAGFVPYVQFDGNNEPKCQPAAVDITFVLELSPELLAHAGVVRYEVSYKGRTRTFTYGEASQYGNRVQLQVEDTCNLREPVGGEVTVRAHVAGAASDPAPLKFQLNAKCAGIGPEPKPPQDAGPPLPTCGVMPDGGVPDARIAEDRPPGDTGPSIDANAAATPDSASAGDTAGPSLDAGADVATAAGGGGGCQLASTPAAGSA